jgi:Zn-dependent protease with chaperone function
MPVIKSDIRIVDGDVAGITDAIKEYLSGVSFKVDQEKITQNDADIKASNLQRSVIKLFLSNSPQLVDFHLEQKPHEQVQIESNFELFKHFRFFHYTCLISFLICCSFCYIMFLNPIFYQFISSDCLGGLFLNKWLYFFFSFVFMMSSVVFINKRGSVASKELFLKGLYETLLIKNFTNAIIIQDDVGIQDLLKSFFLFITFIVATIFISSSPLDFINEHTNISIFLGGLIIVGSVLTMIMLTIHLKSYIGDKGIFLLMGLILCVPITLHSNTPVLLDFSNKFNQVLEKYNEIERITKSNSAKLAIWRKYKNSDNGMKMAMMLIPISYIGLWLAVSLFVLYFFINIIEAPIRTIKSQKYFALNHKDSRYNKSLQPENTSYIFNLLIFFLWTVISITLVSGLYFTLTIFERTIFGSNIKFNSELAILFFENTKTTFSIFLQLISDINTPQLFHKILMIIYTLPILTVFFFVLRKNLKSMIEGYSLLKEQSGKYETIENQLTETIKEMCKSVDVTVPIIRMIDSSDINAETKYLGFPIFKNILVISEGTWNELYDNEDELSAILAHEVWHIKNHTLTRKFLCFLSDYSLFGNGFLTLLQNSFQLEKEADDFAVKWLTKNHKDENKAISSLRSLLEKIEEINWKNTFFQSTTSLNFAMLRDDTYRNELLKLYDSSLRIERLKINLKLLYQMYFGEEILSYFHPSISQRIAWVKEHYGTNEAN